VYLTNNNQIGIPMHRRTNTTIEEVNKSIEELSLQWNVSEKDKCLTKRGHSVLN